MDPTPPSIPGVNWSKWSMPDPLSTIAGPFWDHRRVPDTLPWQSGVTHNRMVHRGCSMDPAAISSLVHRGSHLESSVQVLSAGFPNLSKCFVISWPWIKLIRAERISVIDTQPQSYPDPSSQKSWCPAAGSECRWSPAVSSSQMQKATLPFPELCVSNNGLRWM